MRRVTRDIDPSEALDLFERRTRACIALAGDDGPSVEPVTAAFRDGRCLVGLPEASGNLLTGGEEIVLLVDEGFHFFDLRALYVRGRARSVGEAEGLDATLEWFAVEPTRIAAWDYGRMREAGDEA